MTSSPLNLKFTQYEGFVPVTIVQVTGELDSHTYEQFQSRLLQKVEAGVRRILLDFSQLTYISSAGMRVFYQALDRIESQGGKILFCRLNEDVKQIFQIVNMSSEFPTFTTIEEAIRSLQ